MALVNLPGGEGAGEPLTIAPVLSGWSSRKAQIALLNVDEATWPSSPRRASSDLHRAACGL